MTPGTLPTWGVVMQVKAPLVMVQTFVAWHLELGADWIAVYFDDPDDPAAPAFDGMDRIKVFRCGDKHWAKVKTPRPDLKTVRQTGNAQHAYRRARVDWLAHIDVDEFLWPVQPAGDTAPRDQVIGRVLAAVPADRMFLRLRPHEALIDPEGGEPVHFRAPFRGPNRVAAVRDFYGPHAAAMDNGMLSHSVGKAISRTGIPGFQPRLHAPRIQGKKLPGTEFCDEIALLHFHATDIDDWLRQVEYRARLGAYSGRDETRNFYQSATTEELVAFHGAVQAGTPALVARLAASDMLLRADPRLEEARVRVFGSGNAVSKPAVTNR